MNQDMTQSTNMVTLVEDIATRSWDDLEHDILMLPREERRDLLRDAMLAFKEETDAGGERARRLIHAVAALTRSLPHDMEWFFLHPETGDEDVLDHVPCVWVWRWVQELELAHACVMKDAIGQQLVELYADSYA